MSLHNIPHKSTGILVLIGLLLSIIGIVLYLLHPPFVQSLNYKITDLIMASSEEQPSSGNVVIVDLDDKTLSQYGQWPWSRKLLADLFQDINGHGAKSIALDILMAEPDRTSPGKNQDFTDNDKYLAETIAQGPFVLGYKFLFKKSLREESGELHPLKIVQVQEINSGNDMSFFEARGVVSNLDVFSTAVSSSGFLNAIPDNDGILRRMPLLIQYQDAFYPSLSLAAFMRGSGITTVQVRSEKTGCRVVQVGKKRIPIDSQGNVFVDFMAWDKKVARISAADLLDGIAPTNIIFDKMVVIGSSAAGLEHSYQTSGNPVFSHVAIHAHMLETFLSGQFPARDTRFLFWEGGIAFLLSLFYIFCIMRMGVVSSGVIGGVFIMALWFGAKTAFQDFGYLFSPFLPIFLIVTEYSLLTIVKTRRGQKQALVAADNALLLLKSSENNLNSIIGSIPDIIFRLDSSGKIIFVSPAISRYKRQADDILGQPIFDLVVPEDRHKAVYRVNERRTGRRATKDFELRLRLSKEESVAAKEEAGEEAGEEDRYFSVSAQGLYKSDSSGTNAFVGTQGIVRDITDQKKLEERLLQAEKMQAVGSLAAGVAHDLNNVLSGLVSYPDLMLLDLPQDSPLRKNIEVIRQSGQKAAAIVQDMVAIARRGVTAGEIFSPNIIVDEYVHSPEFSKLKQMHPKISFEITLNDDLLNIKGSPVHLGKAFMNLIINAAEAIPSGGKVLASSMNMYLDSALQAYEHIPEGEYVRLRVEDNGIGISSEDLERIFEPFFTKKKLGGSGTGLGMTVIWATVKDQGGYIDLQSVEGEGTKIDVYLPTTRESAEDNISRVVLQDYLGTEQILVVDDIKEQREIASNMLSKLGYSVRAESSGEAAVESLKRNSVDLVVLDMIMPNGMDGLDTYKEIMTFAPGQKAVVASGFSESDRVKELQKIGVVEYVQKPYTLEKIGVAVRTELDRK